MKRLLRPETLFFLLTWLGLMVAFRDRGFYDPGSLWHIKVGEIILDRGMPQTDPFSFTFEGRRWVPQQWGAEVMMAQAHRAGGLDALLLGFTTGIAFLYTLIFRRAIRGGMGPILAGVLVGGVMLIGAFHYYVRPHMFTIGFLAWTMMCIIDYERGRCSEWRLAGLIPLYVVWVNLHGGVLGGTMILGLAVAGWGVLFLASKFRTPPLSGSEQAYHSMQSPIKSWRTAFLLAGIVVACSLTPFVNPHGLEMLRIWQSIVGSQVLPMVINEHMPMDLSSPLGLAIIGLGGFYLLMLAGSLPMVPRISWLIPLVWFVLSFKGIRQAPLFAVCSIVAMADMWQHTIWHRLLLKYGDGTTVWDASALLPNIKKPAPLWAVLLLPALCVSVSWKLVTYQIEVPVIGYNWARLNPDFIPSDMTREVTDYAASVPPGTPIFNDANLGGFLIYHAPSLKIFMDDRCELYGDDWIKHYSDTLSLPPEELGSVFERWTEQYKFERAIVMTYPPHQETPPIIQYLSGSSHWREVARGKRAVMFERVR